MTATRAAPTPTWVLESSAFPTVHETLRCALASAGVHQVQWDDLWWASEGWPALSRSPVVFHGSLGNAARIRAEVPWRPGAFCDVPAFQCAAWYPRAKQWLIHKDWRILAANELVADPGAALEPLGALDAVFVRPDGPLKPFARRVLRRDQISLAALDHGFYYDDATIPVVVAPVRVIGREWRYVIVDRHVVAGSAYDARDRSARADNPHGEPWAFAAVVAAELEPPERVYTLDVCEADDQLHVVELNPFSGADLYACGAAEVVASVSRVAVEIAAIPPQDA